MWNAFSDIAEEETPQLHMKREDSKPAGAGFIEFRGAEGVSRVVDVTHQVAIVYKCTSSSCHVDIQFGNITRDTLDAEVHDLLGDGYDGLRKAGRSASIRLQAPFVNFDRRPEGQEAAIGEGLDAGGTAPTVFHQERIEGPRLPGVNIGPSPTAEGKDKAQGLDGRPCLRGGPQRDTLVS